MSEAATTGGRHERGRDDRGGGMSEASTTGDGDMGEAATAEGTA